MLNEIWLSLVKCNLVGTRPVTPCCSQPVANRTCRGHPPLTTCMHVARASEREAEFNLGLSLTFGPHADIVQKTTSRRTVEMVVKQLVSLETTKTLFFFFRFLPFCIEPSCVAPPFFEALSLIALHFSCVIQLCNSSPFVL